MERVQKTTNEMERERLETIGGLAAQVARLEDFLMQSESGTETTIILNLIAVAKKIIEDLSRLSFNW